MIGVFDYTCLKKAHVSPIITVLGGQHTDGERLGTTSILNNTLKLSLEFSSRKLLAIVNSVDNVELVVADNSNVGMLDWVVRFLDIRRLNRNTAVVEHVLVRVHAQGFALGIFGFESFPKKNINISPASQPDPWTGL